MSEEEALTTPGKDANLSESNCKLINNEIKERGGKSPEGVRARDRSIGTASRREVKSEKEKYTEMHSWTSDEEDTFPVLFPNSNEVE